MQECKAVYARKRDINTELNREFQFYATKAVSDGEHYLVDTRYDRKTQEVGCQYDCKKDNSRCTCRYLPPPRRRQEVKYFGSPKQIYAYQGSRSFADIGVGSIKALQRKKVKRIYLPETVDRGVGSSDFSSHILQRTKQHWANGYYENKRTSSKCVGGILEYNIGCAINEKLSPIVQTISGSTSYSETTLNKNIKIGSSAAVKKLTNTTTQVETSSKKDIGIKSEMKLIDIVQPIKAFQPVNISQPITINQEEITTTVINSKKSAETKEKPTDKGSSSDSLLQHVHNLENPSNEKNSNFLMEAEDLMENKLEMEYRNIFAAKSKSKDSKYSSHNSDLKSTSTLKRRFEALRRGLAKKDDSKKNAVIVNKVSSQISTQSRKDVSINSDPPSLQGRSFSNTKPYSPLATRKSRDKTMYNPRASHYRQSVTSNKMVIGSTDWSSKAADDDSETQGVKGMFKLWGKKFNLEEDHYKRRCTPKPSYHSTKKTEIPKVQAKPSNKPEPDEKKESRKFFFFKKKTKEKRYKAKKGVTAGRCEVRDGLVLNILGGNVFDPADIERKPEITRKLEDSEDIVRKAWLKKFLTTSIDSRNSVKVRWNNKTYAPSSSTVFELMDNIYKDTRVCFRSKSQVTVQSSYRSHTKQHVNFMQQNIEAWMIPKTFTARSKPGKQLYPELTCKSDEDRNDNMEVRISDQKWFIDKSKAFSHKIEVVLHSKNFRKTNKEESSEYLRIDIPKGFFIDSSCDEVNKRAANQSSDEEVFKIVEYETGSDLKKDKPIRNLNIDYKQDKIKVTVSVKGSKKCVSKVLESTAMKPTRRDVVVQGSNVYIPKKCDVIGVGIITHRDLSQIRKPILKIQDDFSDEESEHNFLKPQTKKCEFAESYLQEYYRHWTPLGIDLYSDTQLKCCSEHSRSSYHNQGDVTKSCPNIFEEFHASAMVSSCGASSCSQCQYRQDKSRTPEFISKSKKSDDKANPDKRIHPKDSIEVFKRRKIYALSAKSKWVGPNPEFLQPSCSSSIESKCDTENRGGESENSPLTECPKLIKSCCKPIESRPSGRKRVREKHVSLPDCDTMNEYLARQLNTKKLDSILAFKGSGGGCDTCKKRGSCPKHAKINPIPSCEIPPTSSTTPQTCPSSESKPSCPSSPPKKQCLPKPPPCPPKKKQSPTSLPCPPSPPCPTSPEKNPTCPQSPLCLLKKQECCPHTPMCPPKQSPSPPPCRKKSSACPPPVPPLAGPVCKQGATANTPATQPCCYMEPIRCSSHPSCPHIHILSCPPKTAPAPPPSCPHSPPCPPSPPPSSLQPLQPPKSTCNCRPVTYPKPPTCPHSPRFSDPKERCPCASLPPSPPPCPPASKRPPSPPTPPSVPKPKPSSAPPTCPPTSPPGLPPSSPPCPPTKPPDLPPSSSPRPPTSPPGLPHSSPPCPPTTPPGLPRSSPLRPPTSPPGLPPSSPPCPPTTPPRVPPSSPPRPPTSSPCLPPSSPPCPPTTAHCLPPRQPAGSPTAPPCLPPSPSDLPPSPKNLPLCPDIPPQTLFSKSNKPCPETPPSCPTSPDSCFPGPVPCPSEPSPFKKATNNIRAKFFSCKKTLSQKCAPTSPREPLPCEQPFCGSLACQHSMTSISYNTLRPDAPFYYSPIHPCPPKPEPKIKKPDRCKTSPCSDVNDDFPWPTKNQVSNQSSTTSLDIENCYGQSYGECKRDCPLMPKMSCETVPSVNNIDCKPSCPNYQGSPRLPCLAKIPGMQCPPPPRAAPAPRAPPPEPCIKSCSPCPGANKSRSRLGGLYLKMKPNKKSTCSKDCLAWENEKNDDGTISLNSHERITIRLKKETPSTEEIREGLNIKVQDEDGITLFERKDYRLQHADCNSPPSLLGEMYKASEIRRVTTNDSTQAIGVANDKLKEVKEVASDASIANLIEIQFKLKVTQGDKTTEIDIANDAENEEKNEWKEPLKKTKQEVFVVKNEGDKTIEHSDQKNDINIRIVIKNFKSKLGKKKSVNIQNENYNDFSKNISAKFHTVSTGYSDIFHDENAFSVHRATVDLTTSVDNTMVNNASIHSNTTVHDNRSTHNRSVHTSRSLYTKKSVHTNKSMHSNRSKEITSKTANEIGRDILTGSSEPSVCKCITEDDKSEDTEAKSFPSQKYIKDIHDNADETTDTQLTDHKYEYNEDTDTDKPIKYDTEETDTDRQVDPPKYDTETDTEKQHNKKYDNFMSTTDTDEPDTNPEIKKSLSLDSFVKPQTIEEKKEMLKHVMAEVHDSKYKNKTRMRKLKDMLKVILTSDSSEHDDSKVKGSDLAKDITYASLKPNYFRDTDSMNNYYKMESKTALSEVTINRQVVYPTGENNSDCSNSVRSVDDLSSENESKRAGGCMCSTLAARLKLASRIGDGGGCCCGTKQINKKSEEITCDLKRESDYTQIDYKTTEFVDVHTQNSRYVTSKINSTNLSVQSTIRPSIRGSFHFGDDIKADSGVLNVDSRQFSLRRSLSPERCHLRDCEMRKRNRNAILSISDEEKVVLLTGHTTRLSTVYNKAVNDKKNMNASDILQSYEAKKAVLEIYAEKAFSDKGEHLVAKLPKFVYDREQEIQANYEAMANNNYKTVCKKNIIMMAIKR